MKSVEAMLLNLSKAFDTMKHELLIAKLYTYRFSKDVLKLSVICQTDGEETRLINCLVPGLQHYWGTTEICSRTNLVQYLS